MRCRQQLGAYHAKKILKKETVALTSREAFWFPVESSNFKWGRDHLFKHNRQQQQCTLLTQQRRKLFLRDILPPRGVSSRVKTWTGYWNLILVINIPTMRLEGSRLWPELFSFMPLSGWSPMCCLHHRAGNWLSAASWKSNAQSRSEEESRRDWHLSCTLRQPTLRLCNHDI